MGQSVIDDSQLRRWKDILWRTYQRTSDDRLLAVAAGVALFPAITALVSLYGLFARPSTISEHLTTVNGFLPSGATDIVQEQVNRLVQKGNTKLGFGFIADSPSRCGAPILE